GLHLERRRVVAADGVELEIEHFGSELAASDNARTMTKHPAPVRIFEFAAFKRTMNTGIEDRNNLIVDFDRVRNQNEIVEDSGNVDGDAGFAGAGRAVQKNRAAGNDSDAESRDEFVGQNQFVESSIKIGGFDFRLLHALRMDAQRIVHERDGSR